MRLIVLGLSLCIFTGAAWAQQPSAPPPVLDQVYACANVSAETERLACYDAAVGRLREAQQSGDLVAVDRAQAGELRRDAFGLRLPSLPRLFGGPEQDLAELALQIESVRHRADGKTAYVMSNGQVWEQITASPTNYRARAGAAVTIRQGAMGSFMMSIEAGGAPLRVRRTE